MVQSTAGEESRGSGRGRAWGVGVIRVIGFWLFGWVVRAIRFLLFGWVVCRVGKLWLVFCLLAMVTW